MWFQVDSLRYEINQVAVSRSDVRMFELKQKLREAMLSLTQKEALNIFGRLAGT